jgi:hypothetical protein
VERRAIASLLHEEMRQNEFRANAFWLTAKSHFAENSSHSEPASETTVEE